MESLLSTLIQAANGDSRKKRSQIFVNEWAAIMNRIRKDHPDLHRNSFMPRRDVVADRIRHIAGGDVAAVFLMHAKPVKQDDLLDLYMNRPFWEVLKALRQIQRNLKPVFDVAPSENGTVRSVQARVL